MLVSVITVLRNAATTIAATISSARDREYDLIERIFIGYKLLYNFYSERVAASLFTKSWPSNTWKDIWMVKLSHKSVRAFDQIM